MREATVRSCGAAAGLFLELFLELFLVLFLGLAAGCGSGAAVGEARACADYAAKSCMAAQRCEPGLVQFEYPGDLAKCVSALQLACQASVAAPGTGATPAMFQQCGDAVAAMSCDQYLSNASDPACRFHGGTIANGGACGDSWQCANGRCASTIGGVVCGACVAQVALGGPCLDIECADGLVCSASAPGSTTRVCSQPVQAGAPCFDSNVCPGNTHCGAATGSCDPLPGVGETCDIKSMFCDLSQSLLLCDPYQGVCQAPAGPVASGACGWTSTTTPYLQCDGYCAINPGSNAGTCFSEVAEGQTCTSADICAVNLQCQGGVCAPLGPTACDGTPADAGSGRSQARRRRATVLGTKLLPI
jgi:hypothetical protein